MNKKNLLNFIDMPIDYSDYPPNWLSEIRPRILARANNCCEDCGVKNYAIVSKADRKEISEVTAGEIKLILQDTGIAGAALLKQLGLTKIVLTIAHLDNDKLNHTVADDRLRALCQRCHLKRDIGHHVENRKYGRNFRKNQQTLF
jgi:hypothetical protein